MTDIGLTKRVHVNVVLALTGLDLYGAKYRATADDPEELATPAEMAKACRALCGMTPAALAPMTKKTTPTRRELLEAAVAKRWACSTECLRKFDRISQGVFGGRRPTLKSHPQFFRDLKVYGAATFKRDGSVNERSLNKGPDPMEYTAATRAGGDFARESATA